MSGLPDIGLDDLLARTEPEGECLAWTGYALHGKAPQWRVDGKLWVARRLIWELTRGPLRAGLQLGVKCDCELCMHPDHLVARTKSVALRGHVVTPTARVRMTLAARARSTTKLSIEKVRAIRAATGQAQEIDQEFGLNPGYASRIRLGKAWVDQSDPFARLGARA